MFLIDTHWVSTRSSYELGQSTEKEEVPVSKESSNGNSCSSRSQPGCPPLCQHILELLKDSVLQNRVDDEYQRRANPSPECAVGKESEVRSPYMVTRC